jgi:hypothetical protein
MSQVNTTCNEEVKNQLYEEAKAKEEDQKKANLASTYGGTIPSHQLQSGLLISHIPCSDRGLNDAKVVLQKGDRGANPIACKKTCDKVVKALKPKISAGNISRILTSVDASEYEVATDAHSWHSSLKLIKKFCIQYGMISLIKIPQGIDLAQPYQVAKATLFKDAINDWQVLNDAVYFNWQEFILQSGTDVKLESDNSLDDTLLISLENMLRAEVKSDLCSLPLSQRGSLTTLCYIIKQLVVKNQEARDALEEYLKTFDISKFPGENVPLACLCLKAIATSLGSNNLPTNVICKLLEDFAKSALVSFNKVCTSQLALCRGSISQKLFKDTSLHTQLVDILKDLESVYLDLVGGKLWAGVNATPQTSSFKVALANGDDANAVVLAAVKHLPADVKECMLAAVKTLPWEEWVKLYATCHHCREKGHIHPMCPKYLAAIQSGEINPKNPCNFHDMRKRPPIHQLLGKIGNRKQPPQNLKDPNAKAFLSAFQALFQALFANE